jgi:hypothetical protein
VLTYRQLCTLAFIAAKQVAEGETRYPDLKTIPGTKPETFRLKQGQYEGASGTPSTETVALLHEIYDLHSRNMVSTGVDLPGSTYIDPSKLRLVLTGFSLYRLMELWEIDKSDIEAVASLLT